MPFKLFKLLLFHFILLIQRTASTYFQTCGNLNFMCCNYVHFPHKPIFLLIKNLFSFILLTTYQLAISYLYQRICITFLMMILIANVVLTKPKSKRFPLQPFFIQNDKSFHKAPPISFMYILSFPF